MLAADPNLNRPDAEQALVARVHSVGTALLIGMATYFVYTSLSRTGVRKKRRKSKRIKRASSKRISSKSLVYTSTIPMRMYFDRKKGGMKLKAEDWFNEQTRLKSLKS